MIQAEPTIACVPPGHMTQRPLPHAAPCPRTPTRSYRPFSTLTFRWTYYYFELDARWYHRGVPLHPEPLPLFSLGRQIKLGLAGAALMTPARTPPGNILLHGIASVMVLLLGRALFVDKVRTGRSFMALHTMWPIFIRVAKAGLRGGLG
jgi:hypothetical protein